MSKESYARGFVKAAAAAGVDPTELAKFAQWYNPASWFSNSGENKKLEATGHGAGIGRYADNGVQYDKGSNPPKATSYLGRLRKNFELDQDDPKKAPKYNWAWDPRTPYPAGLRPRSAFEQVLQEDVDKARDTMAADNASRIFPKESDPWRKIYESLREAGRKNQQNYRNKGVVPRREEADLSGLEDIELSEEEKRLLRLMQNSQVRATSKTRSNIA